MLLQSQISQRRREGQDSRVPWFSHSVTPSSAGRNLPELVAERAEEGGGPVLVSGAAGTGKTILASLVLQLMQEKYAKVAYFINFTEVMKSVTIESWKGRTDWENLRPTNLDIVKYVTKKNNLTTDEEVNLLKLLQEGSRDLVIVLDNFLIQSGCSVEDYVTRLMCEEYGGRGEKKVKTIEALASSLVDSDSKGRIPQRKVKIEQAKLEVLAKGVTTLIIDVISGPGGRVLLSRGGAAADVGVSHKFRLNSFDSVATALAFIKYSLPSTRTQPLEIYLAMHPLIKSLTLNPRMAAILCEVYSSNTSCLKETETYLIHQLLLGWMKIELPHFNQRSIYKLPAEEKEHFLFIAQLAFESIAHGHTHPDSLDKTFSLEDSDISRLNLQSGYSSLNDLKTFGLIVCHGNQVEKSSHPTIQYFLAAFHLSCQPQNYQILFYHDDVFPNDISSFLHLSLFHFGLSRLDTDQFLNPSKIILAAMIESLAHKIETGDNTNRLTLQKLVVGCLYEAQDQTLVKNFTQQYTPLMEMNFDDVRALDDARLTTQLLYVITRSGINLWELVIPSENVRGKADSLVFPLLMDEAAHAKIDVQVQPSSVQLFSLRAKFEPITPRQTGRASEILKRAANQQERELLLKHAMVVTGLRETLHRVTQLFSPVPVRSDATDPAYTSLITCPCIEEPIEKELTFESIHPVHVVQLGSKSKKARIGEEERDQTTKKHMEHHKNSFVELIILNKPSIKSISFHPPGSREICRVLVSSEASSSSTYSSWVAMAPEVKSSMEESHFVPCVQASDAREDKMTMVAHRLPLPKSKKSRGEGEVTVEVAGTRVHGEAVGGPPAPAQVAEPPHKHFQEDLELHQSSATPTQAEAEKITWRPGMIMYTAIPDVFQKYKMYPLPAEDHQIRRGGNGQIFATEYFGYNMVAKKTLYRNREYNIIVRLKHSNVIELLGLMVGEISHGKRFFCYHMLPRMSGDVARMLTDHPELTLSSLKHNNSDDPRRFGLALGNMRYLLAEVLKGLSYLHGLHIIHRDIKASNILVRFHCIHDNVLWCTCPNKYTVTVCDYDAAVELDEEDKMMPISTTFKVFYVPPVGTQGFRSPEGFQLVVSSHSEAISPQLTPRTDIWSLGVLMLRLFLGQEGPASQRLNAMLLLRYHQTKGGVEGKHRSLPELVDSNAVDRILKLNILRDRLSGVNHLVDFVSQCLELDPRDRPSASDLLQHRFLY